MSEDPPRFVQFHIDGFSWLVLEGYQDEILSVSRSGWKNSRLLRATPHRCALWVNGKRHPLFVKRFYHRGIWGLLKIFLRNSASREWSALREAQGRGLPLPRPVAWGQRGRILKRGGFLVTEFLEGAVPAGNYLFGPGKPIGKKRAEAIRKVALLIRRAHDAGMYDRDIHLGNILVRVGKETMELFLIDLQRVDFLRSHAMQVRWKNLAVLHGGCVEARLTDRLRFLKAYLSAPFPISSDIPRLIARLDKEGLRHRFRIWRTRKKRCLYENREFVQVGWTKFSGFVRRDRWDENLRRLLSSPERLLSQTGVRMSKDSRATMTGLLPLPGGALYVRRYNYQGLGYVLKHLCRSSPGRRFWIAANSLRMRGIPVPLPVAYVERRRFQVLLESYVICEAVNGVTIAIHFHRGLVQSSTLQEKRSVIGELALFLRKMHEKGVSYGNLKGPNIMVRREFSGRYCLFLADLEGVRLGAVSWRKRVKDLAWLARELHDHPAVTRSDRLRFLKTYLPTRKEEQGKKLWQSVAKLMAKASWQKEQRAVRPAR